MKPAANVPSICIGAITLNIDAAVTEDIPLLARSEIWWKVKAVPINGWDAPANISSQNVRVRSASPRDKLDSWIICGLLFSTCSSGDKDCPSGRIPTDSGLLRTRRNAGNNKVNQIIKASISQAFLQPVLVIRIYIRIGKAAPLRAPPRLPMAMALPLRRTNHKAIRVVGIRVNEPCPKIRIKVKPAYSFNRWSTWLIQIAAKPNRIQTDVIIIRAPYLSSRRPINIITIPAVKDPAVYKPDTMVLDQPISEIMWSTNMDTE